MDLSLVDEIIYKDLDVFTDSEWPQYLTVSEVDSEKLEPLTGEKETKTLYSAIFSFFKRLASFVRIISEKIFPKVFGYKIYKNTFYLPVKYFREMFL